MLWIFWIDLSSKINNFQAYSEYSNKEFQWDFHRAKEHALEVQNKFSLKSACYNNKKCSLEIFRIEFHMPHFEIPQLLLHYPTKVLHFTSFVFADYILSDKLLKYSTQICLDTLEFSLFLLKILCFQNIEKS